MLDKNGTYNFFEDVHDYRAVWSCKTTNALEVQEY